MSIRIKRYSKPPTQLMVHYSQISFHLDKQLGFRGELDGCLFEMVMEKSLGSLHGLVLA